jgi:TusA-related sulfurtransferase
MNMALSVDAVGLFCPMPVVEFKLGLEMVTKGLKSFDEQKKEIEK